MSLRLIVWARSQRLGDPMAKSVLAALAERAGDDFTCYPSVRRICEDTDISERTVREKIGKLIDLGLVKRLEKPGRSSVYMLRDTTPAALAPTPAAGAPPSSTKTEPSVEPLPAAPPKRVRKPDPVWDALAAVFGAPATKSETSDFAKTVNEIRPMVPEGASQATIEWALKARRSEFLRRYPDSTCSHRVLRNRWAELRPARETSGTVYRELEDGEA